MTNGVADCAEPDLPVVAGVSRRDTMMDRQDHELADQRR